MRDSLKKFKEFEKKYITRDDVPKSVMDAIKHEMCVGEMSTIADRIYFQIKNLAAHKLDKESFAKLFPEAMI